MTLERAIRVLEPAEPIAVGVLDRDHILVSVSIDIIGKHLGPAGLREANGMQGEELSFLSRLLPPTIRF